MKNRFKTRKFIRNKKGFSLIEVLCAVVLLALVATPIIQALYSGLNINLKSRKLLGAADLTAGTTEFVSSLVYDDYSYKNSSGATVNVPGFKSYYVGDGSHLSSLKLSSTGKIYPGYTGDPDTSNPVPVYSFITNGVKISKVYVDGFYYDVEITNHEAKVNSSDTFYTYDVEVKVYEYNKSDLLCSSKTSIANQY